MRIETRVGYVKKYDLTPKKSDLCGKCRELGEDICRKDEICIERLAKALGKSAESILSTVDYASQRGLVCLRTIKKKGKARAQVWILDERPDLRPFLMIRAVDTPRRGILRHPRHIGNLIASRIRKWRRRTLFTLLRSFGRSMRRMRES